MFIPFQSTPNPDALKFLPPARLALGGPFTVERDTAPLPPLATVLFELQDVLRLMIGEDFVTVTRRPGGEPWPALKPQLLFALAGYLQAGAAPWSSAALSPELDGETPSDDALEAEIRQVVALHVRPGAQRDGGDILIERFDAATGVLWIRMEGACNGCPSSQLTLKAGVEQIVRRYVPEVLRVEAAAAAPGPAREAPWRRWLGRAATAAPARARTIFSHNGVARSDDAANGPPAPER